jgi:ABC-type branched-subunit amino acid transport system ATPase component
MLAERRAAALEARDVVKTFGEGAGAVRALRGADLHVRDGEFLAMMGPSGSGKSTLLYILGALDRPTGGSVAVGGRRLPVLERTREIGVLRALGASRWRVRRTMANESLLISIAGTLSGIGVGLLVAMVWIVAMRERTFPGLALKLPVGMLVAIAVLGVVIGVAAAVLPARRAAKLDPLGALRYE